MAGGLILNIEGCTCCIKHLVFLSECMKLSLHGDSVHLGRKDTKLDLNCISLGSDFTQKNHLNLLREHAWLIVNLMCHDCLLFKDKGMCHKPYPDSSRSGLTVPGFQSLHYCSNTLLWVSLHCYIAFIHVCFPDVDTHLRKHPARLNRNLCTSSKIVELKLPQIE